MDPVAEIARLRDALAQRDQQLKRREQELAALREERLALVARAETAEEVARRLRRDLELLQKSITGPSSERFVDPNQLPLPIAQDAPPEGVEPDSEWEKPDDTGKKKRRRRTKNRRDIADMDHLPTQVHHHEHHPLCGCGCGAPGVKVGEDVSWRLDRKPAQFLRHKIIRDRFAFPEHSATDDGVPQMWTAPAPVSWALPGAMCGNDLLVQVVVDKYCDHLPLYRQSQRFGREGMELSRQTLCDWTMAFGELLRPIVGVLSSEVLSGSWLRLDATGLPVLDRSRTKGKAHNGHLWAWGNYDSVVFSYTPNKQGPTVAALFPDFTGVLVMDGATELNLVEAREGVTRAGCWAHARRYLFKALDEDERLATRGLTAIRQLFLAERLAMAADESERIALRDELCRPILTGLRRWIDEELPRQIPKSLGYKALTYLDNQWPRLRVFLEQPKIPVSNNQTERDLRRPVKGKVNYHFAGSPRGARVAAVFYTLIGTCLLQGIDPRRYLSEVAGRLDSDPPYRLTPQAIRHEWLPADA